MKARVTLGLALAAAGVAMFIAPPVHAQGIDFAKVEFGTRRPCGRRCLCPDGIRGSRSGAPRRLRAAVSASWSAPDGVLVVDAILRAPLAPKKVEAAIRAITAQPVRWLIDTHEHPDHTREQRAYFAHHGAVVLAREETLA